MWDWSCGWGSEQIPLQYSGFVVTVAEIVGTNNYRVSLAPAPEPATIALLATGVLGLVGLRRKRRVV